MRVLVPFLVTACLVTLQLIPVSHRSVAYGEEPIVFGRDIRPLLSDRCFTCHGPDRFGQENDLRLDSHEEAIKSAIVPGDSAKSEFFARIISIDPDVKMPPPASGKKPLTEAEIGLMKRWIDSGGAYAEHWAYLPPTKTVPPTVQQGDWPRSDIDRFTLKGMESHNFVPSREATRQALLRRLSFDLTGLPPTYDEVKQFQSDQTPEAYEKQVDRLLASPHFGERMAVYWLDLVRYADTAGYHSDNERRVDAYRDYVIRAFNANKPYDQFTVEQLAGDLLPDSTIEQQIASGYNRLLQTTEEGGAQPKEYTAIYQADRVRNVSEVWLGTTMGCCQCHDHKYDPLSTKEFYQLGAFFADLDERAVGRQAPNLRVPTLEEQSELDRLSKQIDDLKATPIDAAKLDLWTRWIESQVNKTGSTWSTVTPTTMTSSGKQTLTVQEDQSVLASGANPDKDNYEITLMLPQDATTAFRLEVLKHASLVNGSLSRANGNFVLSEVEAVRVDADGKSSPVKIQEAKADYSQPDWPVANTLDGKAETGWAGNGHKEAANRAAMFLFEKPVAGGEGVSLKITLKHQSAHAKHNIGRFRIATTSIDTPHLEGGADLPANLLAVLTTPADARSDAQKQLLEQQYRETAPAMEAIRKEIAGVEAKFKQVNDNVRTMLIAKAVSPRMVRVLPRGNWLDDSGEVVLPAIPAALGSIDVGDRRATRLDLAQWIVDRNNPLTARVFVNRVWQLFYGQSLASVEDFGRQGVWPTHPELLDWLAVDFMEHGWDVKRLVKQMVTSQTYRQSSIVTQEIRQRDPYNQWLARQSRFRISAEFVRDSALTVSGLLVNEIGGRSVKPYQPAKYWQHLNFPAREWQNDTGSDSYRRGLYTFWCRSFLHPSLLAFDATNREECTAQRPRSNTPLQALVLLNDPTYVEAARVLGTQLAEKEGDDAARIERAYQLVLQRDPLPQEREVLEQVVISARERYQADAIQASKVLANGAAPATAVATSAQDVATWTAVARVLLNLHETFTRP